MGVFGSITFSHTPEKPYQVDWQKLVLPVKIDLVEEKFSFLMFSYVFEGGDLKL